MSAVLPFRTRAEVDAEIESVNHLWADRRPKGAGPRGEFLRHGTNSTYSNGCRCSACLHGRREYLRSRGGDCHHDLRASD